MALMDYKGIYGTFSQKNFIPANPSFAPFVISRQPSSLWLWQRMKEPERLHLTTTNLQNVVISNSNDKIYYEVVTPKWDASVTRVSKMDPKSNELEIVAEMQNEVSEKSTARLTSTAVRLRGQQFRPTREFWTKDGVAGCDARFRGKDGKYYQWRQRKGRLELIREQDPDSSPVAVYHKHRRHLFVLRMSRQPYLEVQPSAMETLDSLIVSFLLVEQKRRSKEKELK